MATVRELAALVNGELEGDGDLEISGLNALDLAKAGEISWLADLRLTKKLAACQASALLVPRLPPDTTELPVTAALIRVLNPGLAAIKIQRFFLPEPFMAAGIHPTAILGAECLIPAEVKIGAQAVLGARVRLGAQVSLAPGVVIGDDVVIGNEVVIHPNVTIYPKSIIGDRVIIHSGSVIGADGFGYVIDETGRPHKRPHQGIVRVEDDVEIGANVCIDRATFGETRIGRGSKIDNLVQVGHNVVVGESSLLVAQAGIAGSTSLGRRVLIGGQAALAGHLEIGDGARIAGKSGVRSNQKAGAVVAGYPAIEHKKWLRVCAVQVNLPEMSRQLRELRRQVAALAANNRQDPPTSKELEKDE